MEECLSSNVHEDPFGGNKERKVSEERETQFRSSLGS